MKVQTLHPEVTARTCAPFLLCPVNKGVVMIELALKVYMPILWNEGRSVRQQVAVWNMFLNKKREGIVGYPI